MDNQRFYRNWIANGWANMPLVYGISKGRQVIIHFLNV